MRAVAFTFLLPAVLAAANLLPNGDFENNIGWKAHGTKKGVNPKDIFQYDTAAARSGTRGMRVNDVWDFAKSYPVCRVAPVKDAQAYRFSLYARAVTGKQTFRIGIFLPYKAADGKIRNLSWTEKEFTVGTEWQKCSMEVKANPRAEEVGVLIGATSSKDYKLTGSVYVDEAVLETCEWKPAEKKNAPVISNAGLIYFFRAAPEADPQRAEWTGKGFRLKPGVKTNVMDPAAAPDVRFTGVDIPQDGYYRFYARVEGPRCNAYCRIGIPGFPATRTTIMRPSMHSGDRREIGVYPLKKGKQIITLTLPDKLTVTSFVCKFDGPRPLPKEIAEYKLPVKPAGRPRLLINQERLAALRKNRNHPELARAFDLLKADASHRVKLVMKDGCEVENQPLLQKKLIARALFSMLDNDKALAHDTAQTMHRYITRLTGFPGSNYFYDIRDAIFAAGIVYDWCYDEFTPEQRKDIIAAFYRLAVRLEVSWPPLRIPITIGHGNGGQITISPLAFAIACFDEDPEPFRIITYRVLNELVPMKAYEYRSPLHPQGSNYGSPRLRADLFCASAYRVACGKEIFNQNLYTTPMYWQMLRLPDTFYFEEGDIWGFFRPPQELEECLLFCYAASGDPAVKGFYQGVDGDLAVPLYHVLFNNTDLKPVNPREKILPYSYHFGPFHGSLIARTGFYGDEAAVYCHGGMKYTTNHQHYDAGAFQIWFRGLLAADIGEYQSSYGNNYDMNFDKRSIAHNMLRVYDPAEKFGRFDNDGGSRWITKPAKTPKEYEDPYYDYGVTKSVSIGPDKMRPVYSVMTTDLTSAYSSKIKHYERTVVFLNQRLKENPASFIVLDLCETSKAEFPKIFQVSTYLPPELKPGFIGLSNENGGRADMNICLPKDAKVTDFANEKAASNPFVGKVYELPIPGTEGHHAHRIEITPPKAQTFDTFLNCFAIHGDKTNALPGKYAELANAHLIRTGKFMVTLPKAAEFISTPLQFSVPDDGMEVLCIGLKPGKWHSAGANFTVNAGENTLFLRAKAGKLEIVPGELAGAPAYQVPADILADAPQPGIALCRDGKVLPGKPVFDQYGNALVPADSFSEGKIFKPGVPAVLIDNFTIGFRPDPCIIGGQLYVPASAMAGVIHARADVDRFLQRITFTDLPKTTPVIVAVSSPHRPEELYRMIDKPKTMGSIAYWAAWGKNATFTLAFDRPVRMGSFLVEYSYGETRDFPVTLEASMDGKTFHKVFSGMSTHKARVSVFRWKPEMMRFLRYTGTGATDSPWTSINKISVNQGNQE